MASCFWVQVDRSVQLVALLKTILTKCVTTFQPNPPKNLYRPFGQDLAVRDTLEPLLFYVSYTTGASHQDAPAFEIDRTGRTSFATDVRISLPKKSQ